MAVFLARRHSRMAVPTMFIAATAAASLASFGAAKQASDEVNCVIGGEKINFSITEPGGTLKVTCVENNNPSQKTIKAPLICADDTCSEAKPSRLQLACPGGTEITSEEESRLTITCPQLPNTTTSIQIRCGQKGPEREAGICTVELTVSAPPPEGPQVCSAAGTTVTLAVHGEGAQTQFACATGSSGLTALNPPQPNKVYKEDCSTEEVLKDLKLTTGNPYHTLAAIKNPRSRKLCYLCKAGPGKTAAGEPCKILIDVSAGSGRSERSALGLALGCALALLRLV